ncbi:thioredoxin H1 isoform X1 [Cryptomeria japonica]|uniref:thioredoxin H1 isoform X1 n=1 Tax=Cryptomeria japonica TaxID=3369 RepID=UPI0027DA3E61|nr:thioredoxin H1 isoform X1 [Cryptomeria japonica]
MAQLLTTLHSCAINPPSLSSPNSVHKVGLTHYNLSCVFETRNSLGKSIAASPRPVTSKRLRRQIGCSASNSSGGKKGNVIEVEDGEELEKYIQDAGDKLVVVDVSTTTCGPCKLIYPKVVNMSIEYPDTLFYKINGDKSSSTRALMRKWGVRAVPNFRFYRKGELLHSHSGAKEDELRAQFLIHYVGVQRISS